MKKYKILMIVSVLAIGLMSALLASINEKKEEQVILNEVPKVDRWETKNEEFRKHYPRQYDSWKETKNSWHLFDLFRTIIMQDST